ncbi:MAG TPA: hypothetical protein V6C69_02945 [Trichormus sp.]
MIKLLRLLLSCSVVLILSDLICDQARAANQAGADGYMFKTKDSDWGPVDIYVSPFGVKKVLHNLHFTMVASAPKWQLIAYREDCKQICYLTAQENPLITLPPATKVTRTPITFKGLPAVKEIFPFAPTVWDETQSMVGMIMPTGNSAKASMTMVGSETIRLCAKEFSPELLRAAGRILVNYPGDGLVIENRFIQQNGKRFTSYLLVDWKRTKLSTTDFAAPKNYSVCHSFREFKGKSVDSQMEDLAKQMDFGEPLGSSNHH